MKFVCPEDNRAFRLFQCCNEQLSALNLRLPHEASEPNQRLACERTDPAEGGASSDCPHLLRRRYSWKARFLGILGNCGGTDGIAS